MCKHISGRDNKKQKAFTLKSKGFYHLYQAIMLDE